MTNVETVGQTAQFRDLLNRLSSMSANDYYNPYTEFEWPDELPTDQMWTPIELMSPYGTEVMEQLSDDSLLRLSQWEAVNFYSVNVHGIKELLGEVVARLHSPGFEDASEFFHHFIGEENEHAWFFAEFCRRYGGKLYPIASVRTESIDNRELENFLVFARILIFEEMVDHFNTQMADDDSLHPTIRLLNRVHHKDESRHIAFGRQLVQLLFAQLRPTINSGEAQEIEAYLKRYMRWCTKSLYNPDAYRDANLENPFAIRRQLAEHPERNRLESEVFLRKPIANLVKIGVFSDGSLAA